MQLRVGMGVALRDMLFENESLLTIQSNLF